MLDWFRTRRWAWGAVALATVLTLGGVGYGFGVTKSAQTPLWTEQPTAAAPTAPAPDWVKIGHDLKPAVVNVSTKRLQAASPEMGAPFGEDSPFDRFFKDHFGSRPQRPVRSMGSGFIINSNGYIVTNNHVVDGATQLQVKLSDGREFTGKVVGRDPKTDVALLKIETTGLAVIPLGDSSALQVGEPVMAIGNPFGLEQTVTTGIVSATGRAIGAGPYDDFIQTDASINPGNSGGPLINARGQAVGINTAIFSQSGGSVGIGFAIPVSLAKAVVTQLAESGSVTRAWLGVAIQPVTPDLAKSFERADTAGALVSSVTPGSPASRAGLKPGDIITRYDGRAIARVGDLPRAVAETRVGRHVPLTVVRDGKSLELTARVEALESKESRQASSEPDAKPALGLAVQPLTPEVARRLGVTEREGLVVQGVEEGSPAVEAGFERGDVIVEVNRQPAKSVALLKDAVAKREKGKPILFRVERQGTSLYLTVAA